MPRTVSASSPVPALLGSVRGVSRRQERTPVDSAWTALCASITKWPPLTLALSRSRVRGEIAFRSGSLAAIFQSFAARIVSRPEEGRRFAPREPERSEETRPSVEPLFGERTAGAAEGRRSTRK
jgi:hypothetical protein